MISHGGGSHFLAEKNAVLSRHGDATRRRSSGARTKGARHGSTREGSKDRSPEKPERIEPSRRLFGGKAKSQSHEVFPEKRKEGKGSAAYEGQRLEAKHPTPEHFLGGDQEADSLRGKPSARRKSRKRELKKKMIAEYQNSNQSREKPRSGKGIKATENNIEKG